MLYTVILINSREYDITEAERDAFLSGPGMVLIERLNVVVNTSSISVIEPKGLGKVIDRAKQIEGRLHDGSRVIKKFGMWADAVNPDVHINLSYYPEIAGDFVPTPEEFAEHIERLPSSQRLEAMRALASGSKDSGGRLERLAGPGGFQGVKSITDGRP